MIEAGENIVTTHSLFSKLNREVYNLLKARNYVLIIDEVLDAVDIYGDLTPADRTLLFDRGMVKVNPDNQRLEWNYPTSETIRAASIR